MISILFFIKIDIYHIIFFQKDAILGVRPLQGLKQDEKLVTTGKM
jgi:hypothetical protein